VTRVSLSSQVMERLKQYIEANNLEPGARLPPERELTEQLGVSRNVLRDGMKSLEAVGVIEIRVGDGTYVSNVDYSSLIDHVSFAVARNSQEFANLLQARIILELALLDLVTENCRDKDVARLRKIADRIEQTQTLDKNLEMDLEFHRALVEITRNPILIEISSFLRTFFLQVLFAGHDKNGANALLDKKFADAEDHRGLCSALEDGDTERAKTIMRDHVLRWANENGRKRKGS